jgi:hypothetical protein
MFTILVLFLVGSGFAQTQLNCDETTDELYLVYQKYNSDSGANPMEMARSFADNLTKSCIVSISMSGRSNPNTFVIWYYTNDETFKSEPAANSGNQYGRMVGLSSFLSLLIVMF